MTIIHDVHTETNHDNVVILEANALNHVDCRQTVDLQPTIPQCNPQPVPHLTPVTVPAQHGGVSSLKVAVAQHEEQTLFNCFAEGGEVGKGGGHVGVGKPVK